MRTIYELDTMQVWTGNSREITDREGRPVNWVHSDAPPPELTGTQVAKWLGVQWVILDSRPVPPEPVPTDVSAAAAREALIDAGLLARVHEVIDDIPDPVVKQKAASWFEFATRIRRASPWVAMLAPALDLDDAALDDLFRAAAVIEQSA